MVKPIKDKKTGKWHIGSSPGAHLHNGAEYKRVFAIVMKLQKKHKSFPFRACTPSCWLANFEHDWVADDKAFEDCWNHINEFHDYEVENIVKHIVSPDLDDDEKDFLEHHGMPCFW